MPKRFISEQQLCFSVLGRPLCQGNNNNRLGDGSSNRRMVIKNAYKNIIRLSLKTAMVEQGWVMTEDPVYIIITVNLKPEHTMAAVKKRQMDNYLPVKAPHISKLQEHFIKSMKGVVFPSERYIAGLVALKKYSAEEGIEVLVGKANSLKDLKYDLRNA